jgi:hypothetical protein
VSTTAESEARKALQRLRRSVEKSLRELRDLQGALQHAEAEDFPADAYAGARSKLEELRTFVDEEAQRLQEKILHAGGLEPGRVRRMI